MGFGGAFLVFLLLCGVFASVVYGLDYYRKNHGRIMLPDDDFGLGPEPRRGTFPVWVDNALDFSIAFGHTAAEYIVAGAKWTWEHILDGYDWVVFKLSGGRAGGYSGSRPQYRPLDGGLLNGDDRTLILDDY